MAVDPAFLENLALRAWPPVELARLGEWRLAASGGYAMRINSAWPLGDSGLPDDEAIDAVERWYAQRGLPVWFKLADGASPGLDEVLARRGYRSICETLVMVGPVAGAPDPEARLAPAPDADFGAVFVGAGVSEAEAAERLGALARTPAPAVFARLDINGAPAAIGACPIDGEWCGLFGMRTAIEHRRKGLARRLVGALLAAGHEAGARRAYLQVDAWNDAAITLYRGFGFEAAYGYRYRVGPNAI